MKKNALWILAALMLCTAAAFAEEAAPQPTTLPAVDGYEITAVIPDGYTMNTYELELGVLFALVPDDPARANVVMTVTHSEEMDGLTLNGELTEEQEAQLRASLLGDAVNPEISHRETAHGTHLILVHEQSEADEYLVILTLWNGYIIETDVFPGEGTNELTDEQINTAIQFISDFFIFEKAGE